MVATNMVATNMVATNLVDTKMVVNTILRLHQFLGTKTTEANKSLKTDANGTY